MKVNTYTVFPLLWRDLPEGWNPWELSDFPWGKQMYISRFDDVRKKHRFKKGKPAYRVNG